MMDYWLQTTQLGAPPRLENSGATLRAAPDLYAYIYIYIYRKVNEAEFSIGVILLVSEGAARRSGKRRVETLP